MKLISAKTRDDRNIIPGYKYVISGLLVMSIMLYPFIAHLKIYKLSDAAQILFEQTDGFFVDLFLYYKEMFIIVIALLLVLIFIGEHIFPDRRIPSYQLKSKKMYMVYVCTGGFLLMALLSFINSDYKYEGIMGLPTECEGILVWISYIIILLAGIHYFGNETSLKIFRVAIVIFAIIWIAGSLIELLYKPLFEIDFFRNLLAPTQYREALKSIRNEEYQGMITLTMYNPNYYGGMCVLLFPFMLSSFFEEKTRIKWGYLILSIGVLICTIGSKSTAPLYCVVIEMILLTVFSQRSYLKSLKDGMLFLVLFLLTVITLSLLTKGKFISTLNQTLTNTGRVETVQDRFVLDNLEMYDDKIVLVGESNDLTIEINPEYTVKAEYTVFKDSEGNALNRIIQGTNVTLEDSRYKGISINVQEFLMLIDLGYDAPLRFYVTTEGFRGVGPNGTVLEKVGYGKNELSRFDSFATGRGYTWIRMLPLLRECIMIGKGPGTFPYYFPQFDYVGLLNTHGSADFVIDKAHNMYLQIWVHIGFIGLLFMLVLFVWIIIQNIKLKSRFLTEEKLKNSRIVRKGSFVAIVGWLIYALVNDSIITVSPMFWFVMGINIAIIVMVEREREQDVA